MNFRLFRVRFLLFAHDIAKYYDSRTTQRENE